MKNFNRSGGSSDRQSGGSFGRRDSGGRGFNRGGDSARPEMHRATCSDCGASCEVPFKPSGDKPVFCSNCFKGKDGASSSRSGGREYGKSNFGEKRLFQATCADCGQSCEVPFQPSSGKPVYCSTCFSKNEGSRNSSAPSFHGATSHSHPSNDQLEMLNAKLDKILHALTSMTGLKTSSKVEELKPETVKEVKKIEPIKVAKKIVKKTATPIVKKVVKSKKK